MASFCACQKTCGDDGDIDGPGTCKGLPIKREPLVEVVMVPRYKMKPDGPEEGIDE